MDNVTFLNSVLDLFTKWLSVRNLDSANFLNFAVIPTISLKQWTSTYHWALANKKILQEPYTAYTFFYTTASKAGFELDIDLWVKFKNYKHNWSNFDDFKMYNHNIWVIFIKFDNLDTSTCTCPIFLK